MRGLMIVMLLSLPVATFADGDPNSLTPPLPPPAIVTTPLPPPVAEAPLPQLPAAAAEPTAVEPVRAEGFGSDTRYWVATQISGSQSVTEVRPMSGEVAQRVYARYLKSFEYPIPETFKRDSFGTGSSSGASTR
jgi:hypothetical protein